MEELKVMHVLRSYLPVTENWLFHLLYYAKGIRHTIYCEKYLPGSFETQKFSFLILPSRYEPNFGNTIFSKIKRFIYGKLLKVSGTTKVNYFKQLAESEKPDILHIHFGTMALVYEKYLINSTIPFIVSFYGYDYSPLFNYEKIFSKAAAIICEGKAGKEQLISLGCPEDRIVIVPLGIIPSQSTFIKKKPAGRLNLVQIASFTEKKGQIYAIKAVEDILANCPNISLTLIGPESEEKNRLLDYIKQKELGDYIKFKGVISFDNLNDELCNYDVFIHPSTVAKNGDNEGGAPVVLLNAQNCGLPVISTFHKDIPQYVIHGKTGLLSPENDIKLLAKNILEFYNMTPDIYEEYAINAKNHVGKNFNIESLSNSLPLLYKNIKKNKKTINF
jgi:colanic acid/amylovoran biosynthesis glycosyltransferase